MKNIVFVLAVVSAAGFSSCCFYLKCDECMDNYLYIKMNDDFTTQEIDSFLYQKEGSTAPSRLVHKDGYRDSVFLVLL